MIELSDNIRNWAAFAAAIVALPGFCYTVNQYRRDVRARRAQEDLGTVCCSQRRMGYFVANQPWWGDVAVPQIPAIAGLLRAADANKWTSAMVDGIRPNFEDEVCWKQFYEAFFRQLVWDDISAKQTSDKVSHTVKRARSAVEGIKKGALGVFDLESQLPLPGLYGWHSIFHDISNALKNLAPFAKHLEHGTGRSYPDRHLLYRRVGGSPAILVSCVRPLDCYKSKWDDILEGEKSIWSQNTGPLWIHELRPCIPVSKYEVIALCLIFGIDKLHSDVGAFGLSLSWSSGTDSHHLHFVHSERRLIQSSSRGSGYSMLFAKYMACGCLPFGQSRGWTKVIRVDITILQAIRSRSNIVDTSDGIPDMESTDILKKLPRISVGIDLFVSANSVPFTQPNFGLILDKNSQSLDPLNPNIGRWWTAVAGIAFGGLVPCCTRNLVEALRFTAQGTDSLGGSPDLLLEQIQLFINEVHKHARHLELFGPFVTEACREIVEVDNFTLLPTSLDTTTVAPMCGRYMTLLERLVALTPLSGASAHQSRSEAVFVKLCDLLKSSYQEAVEQQPRNDGQAPPRPFSAVNLLERCRILSKKPLDTISIDDCAEVARLLIIAWTYVVTIVEWPGELKMVYKLETMNTEDFRLMDLADIPDFFALGGYSRGVEQVQLH